MILYIKNNKVIAAHSDDQNLDDKYDYDQKTFVDDRTKINENKTYTLPVYEGSNSIHVERLRSAKIKELKYRIHEKVKVYAGTDLDTKLNNIIIGISLVRKENLGTITPDELTNLNNLDAIQSYVYDLRVFETQQISNINSMSFTQLENYDVLNSPTWPTEPILT